MEFDYEKWIEENESIVERFRESLENHQLSPKTVHLHVRNISFYLNTYVARYENENYLHAEKYIGDFLGYFFIRKCMWSTPASIKTYVTSFKKFYRFLLDEQIISKSQYREIIDYMNDWKEDWMEECAIFNDPSSDYFMF